MAGALGFAQSGERPQKWREPPSKRNLPWCGVQGVKVLETRCISVEFEYTEISNFSSPDALMGTTVIDRSFPYGNGTYSFCHLAYWLQPIVSKGELNICLLYCEAGSLSNSNIESYYRMKGGRGGEIYNFSYFTLHNFEL